MVIFHSIIMLRLVLSFAFQAEKDYFIQGRSILDPLDLAYDIFIAFYLELQQVHAYHTRNHYINLTKPEVHMIYVTVPFFYNSSFTFC